MVSFAYSLCRYAPVRYAHSLPHTRAAATDACRGACCGACCDIFGLRPRDMRPIMAAAWQRCG